MKCRGCGKEYIGVTGNVLRKRVSVHNQQIRDPSTRMTKVSEHIDNFASLKPTYFIFPSILKMNTESQTLRKAIAQVDISLVVLCEISSLKLPSFTE